MLGTSTLAAVCVPTTALAGFSLGSALPTPTLTGPVGVAARTQGALNLRKVKSPGPGFVRCPQGTLGVVRLTR